MADNVKEKGNSTSAKDDFIARLKKSRVKCPGVKVIDLMDSEDEEDKQKRFYKPEKPDNSHEARQFRLYQRKDRECQHWHQQHRKPWPQRCQPRPWNRRQRRHHNNNYYNNNSITQQLPIQVQNEHDGDLNSGQDPPCDHVDPFTPDTDLYHAMETHHSHAQTAVQPPLDPTQQLPIQVQKRHDPVAALKIAGWFGRTDNNTNYQEKNKRIQKAMAKQLQAPPIQTGTSAVMNGMAVSSGGKSTLPVVAVMNDAAVSSEKKSTLPVHAIMNGTVTSGKKSTLLVPVDAVMNGTVSSGKKSTLPDDNDQELKDEQHNNSFAGAIINTDYTRLSHEQLRKLNARFMQEALKGPLKVNFTYTLPEYEEHIVEAAEKVSYIREELEQSNAVRAANSGLKEGDDNQTHAQYGRTMEGLGVIVFELSKLKAGDVFVDIGHGIGNICFQAAYTIGCESRGIEVVGDRHNIAEVFKSVYEECHTKWSLQDGKERKVGDTRLRHGHLEHKEHREFLTDGVDVVFCNNFNEVFGSRSNRKSVDWFLDDYIAGLFTQLKPGAKLICLSKLLFLPPPLSEANKLRRSRNLKPSTCASFYSLDQINNEGGANRLNFTEKEFKIFIYTKLSHPYFTCNNPSCEGAKKGTLIKGFEVIGENQQERLVPTLTCPCCKTNVSTRRSRAQAKYN